MFALVDADQDQRDVQRITLVPFLSDGRCVLIDGANGPELPCGEVRMGEDPLFDTVLRVPMETAGFRYQRFRPVGRDGSHLYGWVEGAPYSGSKPHATVPLHTCTAEEAAARLTNGRQPLAAEVVMAAARSYRNLDDRAYFEDNRRRLEHAYLRGQTAQEGSGFGGDSEQWLLARHHITEAIDRDGTFLDVGCANGLLMESVVSWCAERGIQVEPYGVDLSPGLAELAQRRLPQWADRIWVGNAIDWVAPDGLRFDYVHLLLDCVPRTRRSSLIQHHLASTCAPGTGKLLVSHYGADPDGAHAPEIVRDLGFTCSGQSSGGQRHDRPPEPTAWINASGLRPATNGGPGPQRSRRSSRSQPASSRAEDQR